MKRLSPAVAILVFLLVPQAAQAQVFFEIQLAKVDTIIVDVSDNVKDGCLPSPNVLKVEAELILRRSGLTVTDDKTGGGHHLTIRTIGFAVNSGTACVGRIDVELDRWELLADNTPGLVVSAIDVAIHIAPKLKFQDALRNDVNEKVTAFANEILKARGQ